MKIMIHKNLKIGAFHYLHECILPLNNSKCLTPQTAHVEMLEMLLKGISGKIYYVYDV